MASSALAHDIHADGHTANDWIEKLVNGSGASCCGQNDCYPLPPGALRFSPGAEFSVEIRGHWLNVPQPNVLPDSSPDGRAWICPNWAALGGFFYTVQGVRCVLLPPFM
jgi:hypothetical protein